MTAPTSRCIFGSISFPRGSAASILSTYAIAHFAAYATSGSVNYDTSLLYTVLLGYLSEMWLSSAAREQGTDIDDPVSFTLVKSLSITRNDLRQLFIDFTFPPKGGFSEGEIRKTGDYGYCQFIYPNGAVDLIHISWQHSKLVPPRPGCTSVNLWFREELSGSYRTIFNSVGAPQVVCDGTHPVSPSSNVMTGTAFGTSSSVTNFQDSDIGLFHPPTVLPSGWSTCDAPQEAAIDLTTLIASGPWPSAILAFLCESWQDIVQPQHGIDEGPYLLTEGENIPALTLAWLKQAKLTVTPPGRVTSRVQWRFGIPFYGSWAPLYGDYAGPIHPLNIITSNLIPDYRLCTGLWIFLKEGCTGSLSTQEALDWTQPVNNPSGGINLAQGITDGLTWDV